jgi:hypothetical protein
VTGSVILYPKGEAASLPPITCIAWKPNHSEAPSVLKGWADLHLPKMRLRLHGCPLFYSATFGSAWAGLPSREIGRDAEGKPRYAAMAAWDTRDIQNAFSQAAVAAVSAYAPDWREGRH